MYIYLLTHFIIYLATDACNEIFIIMALQNPPLIIFLADIHI